MNTESIPQERRFGLSPDELAYWNTNGYLVRLNVFSPEENEVLRQVAEDVVDGKRPYPSTNVNQNALVRDGKIEEQGIYAMHKIHHPSCYCPEFLARVRDPRLTDPLVDILGPDILGINNLFIWKAPKIGLGFPWHQDKFYFRNRFDTETTVGTWTAIDPADRENGCLYVIPPAAINGIFLSMTILRVHNNASSSWHAVPVMKTALLSKYHPVRLSGSTAISCIRVRTIIVYGSDVVMLSTTSVRKQNGHILLP